MLRLGPNESIALLIIASINTLHVRKTLATLALGCGFSSLCCSRRCRGTQRHLLDVAWDIDACLVSTTLVPNTNLTYGIAFEAQRRSLRT